MNPHSRWSSPVLIVPKSETAGWLQDESGYEKSQLSSAAIWGCLSILEVILQHLTLASVFASFDVFKRFWSFPEIYSSLTDLEWCSCIPRLELWHFERSLDFCLKSISLRHIGLLKIFWEASSKPGQCFRETAQVQHQVKPQEQRALALHIFWCERKISKDGVSFDPAYLKGLLELPRPEMSKHLQHSILCP